MAKKNVFFCKECGFETDKWSGKCPSCNEWNTIVEAPKNISNDKNSILPIRNSRPIPINEITNNKETKVRIGIDEFDRVLGGGIVRGSLILIGGDPGIGKSTIVLQTCKNLSDIGKKVIYVSGEESQTQIKLRSNRIGTFNENFYIYCETNLSDIVSVIENEKPDFLIIDSIQTMINNQVNGVAGSISQVKESTALLLNLSKITGISIIIIGHVTKEGTVAGPRLLEHMVDTVLYIEGERFDNYRILRGVKNRFGATNEIGVFEMTSTGLKEVENPSKMMLNGRPTNSAGSIVTCIMEGSRPILIEIQALVSKTNFAAPRRTAVGVDYNRINLLIAVIEKRLKIQLSTYDAYVNIVGGIKAQEPALDLAIILALLSSYYNKPFGLNLVAFGEVGLAGEVRAVTNVSNRINEAIKIGFNSIILPESNIDNLKSIEGVKLRGIKEIHQLINK